MKKILHFLICIFTVGCLGCASVGPPPFIPYKEINSTFPKLEHRYYTPLILRDIDQSNIRVICNNRWWYAGPERGWYSINSEFDPKPRDVWPDRVYNRLRPEQYLSRGTSWKSNILFF